MSSRRSRLIALGTEAAMAGHRVKYILATKLVDELGSRELDRHGAGLFFRVLTEREEENSVAIASAKSFGGWAKTFTGPRLCAAIVDRLTSNGTLIETGTDSYRLATTRAQAERAAG
ncbi:hypothetical protein GCM10010275_13990 [Streptomyces litmocidini]|nr:hypothetical protein GCM10010275_13990 [Streptomyces litmocidini]